MDMLKRCIVVGAVGFGVPYMLIYLFIYFGNDVALGKIFAVLFFDTVVILFFIYQIFIVAIPTKAPALNKGISIETVKKANQIFRIFSFFILLGFAYFEFIPFTSDAYKYLTKNEYNVIEAKYHSKKGNLLFDRFRATDGEMYSRIFSSEHLQSSISYNFIVLPKSKIILKNIGAAKNKPSKI